MEGEEMWEEDNKMEEDEEEKGVEQVKIDEIEKEVEVD